ncbi:hypothetical protein ACEPPN_002733 [Leptodophora sp. 'Broadleaf-Isolate-01']
MAIFYSVFHFSYVNDLFNSDQQEPSFPDPRLSQALHNTQENTSATILDESGSLIVRIYTPTPNTSGSRTVRFLRADCVWTDGVVVAQFQVSARAMTENSGVFKAAFENNDWLACDNSYIDMESSDASPVEIVLRAFHEVYTDEMLYATRTEAEQVLNTLTAFNAPKSKLKYWFFHWLTSKDMRQFNGDDGPSMKLTSQHLPKSIANYPPIVTPSFRQLSEIIFLKRDVKPSEYVSGGFSKIFQYAYGKPMEYWSDFYALMTTKDISHLTPQTKDKNKDKAW